MDTFLQEEYPHYEISKEFEYLASLVGESICWGFDFPFQFIESYLPVLEEKQEKAEAVMIFAKATGTSSSYGLWNKYQNSKTGEMPVVILGDEGGLAVVADNIKDFIRLLSIGTEPYVGQDYAYYSLETDEEALANFTVYLTDRDDFLERMKNEYGLEPITSDEQATEITAKAEEKHRDDFFEWISDITGTPKEDLYDQDDD